MNRPSTARLWLLLASVSAWAVTAPAESGRRLGTCGPPPRKSPERQTSAESMAPLPLPVTPLRRSEPKAEPSPPILMAKLDYGTTQDWNTDPGDIDNLTRHCRYELGLWYGWKTLSMKDLVAMNQSGERCRIPFLYLSGHDAIGLTDEERLALRQYLLDGGTLLGDACCGRSAFAESFRKEVIAMFPDRAFDLLEVDHPIYRAFYPYNNVHAVEQNDGAKNETQGPPQLLAMNIGCRAAAILTVWDMSCGWDEHTHDHGSRLIPGDAIRLGVNLISYCAALRPLAESQSVTREIQAPIDRSRQQLVFAQLRHQGDWNPDPNSVYQLLRHVAMDSSLAVDFRLKYVDADESQLAGYPFLYMTGHRDPKLGDRELAALQRHLQAGGFLFINNCCGRSAFDRYARSLVKRMFADQDLTPVPADHPLCHAFFDVAQVRDRLTGAARPPELEGIKIKDRLVLVYSKHDMVTDLKQASDPYGDGFDAESCRQLALNVVAYALQH